MITSGNIDVELQDAAGTVLASGLPGATNVDRAIHNFVAPATGTYYAVITGNSGTQYSMVVTRNVDFDTEDNNTPDIAQDIDGTSGVLGYASDDDYYSIQMTAGAAIRLSTATPGGGPLQFANDLDPRLDLYDPSGLLAASDDNSAIDGRNAVVSHAAAVSGTYRIRVAAANGTGEYLLRTDTIGNVVQSQVFITTRSLMATIRLRVTPMTRPSTPVNRHCCRARWRHSTITPATAAA